MKPSFLSISSGMASNESLLAQLRAEFSSDNSNSCQTKRMRFHSGNSSSSSRSEDARRLSQLEHRRQNTPGSEPSNEQRLSQIQSQNVAGVPEYANEEAPESLDIRSGEEADSEPDNTSYIAIDLGKQTSQTPIPDSELPAMVEMLVESDGYSSGHPSSPSIPYQIAGEAELQSSEAAEARSPCNSSSSGDEITRPRGLQSGQYDDGIRDLPLSSVDSPDEGMGHGTEIQSMAGQEAHVRPLDNNSFDYRKKLSPLSTQQLRSFVFHDLTVTHHVPRIAIQGFSSLHISERPSDPRTTKKMMGVLTGLKEVRYDCCIEGCISYSLPQYASLKECPIHGCKHPRYKTDGNPFAQHSYIPITHRLQLMYSDKERAIEMMTYRSKMDEEIETGVCNLHINQQTFHA